MEIVKDAANSMKPYVIVIFEEPLPAPGPMRVVRVPRGGTLLSPANISDNGGNQRRGKPLTIPGPTAGFPFALLIFC